MPRDAENTDDDAALHWGGDDIQAPRLPSGARSGHAVRATAEAAPTAAATSGTLAEPHDATPDEQQDGADDTADGEMSNATLVGLGLLGGVYLLFTLGWVIGALRLQQRSAAFAANAMFSGAFWLAVLAPAAWFVASFVLTRGRPPWPRIVALAAGAVLLVPWPFLSAGTVTL